MPEIPEVQSLANWLGERTAGLVIERADILAISALKTFDPPLDALKGRAIVGWSRRGKFLIAETRALGSDDTDPIYLCIHLARAGWLRWSDEVKATAAKLTKGPQALRMTFNDGSGFTATEAGTDKRLAVHVTRDPEIVERIRTLGVDALGPIFTVASFSEILKAAGRSQIKGVLTDQALIAGIGNAYSDEALHVAKLSPFKPSNSLTAEEGAQLHSAIVGVFNEALERSAGKPVAELKDAKRSGMRVHGRTGQKCPECNDVVREVAFSSKSIQYCATCQTGGKPLADRRMSRLLK